MSGQTISKHTISDETRDKLLKIFSYSICFFYGVLFRFLVELFKFLCAPKETIIEEIVSKVLASLVAISGAGVIFSMIFVVLFLIYYEFCDN